MPLWQARVCNHTLAFTPGSQWEVTLYPQLVPDALWQAGRFGPVQDDFRCAGLVFGSHRTALHAAEKNNKHIQIRRNGGVS